MSVATVLHRQATAARPGHVRRARHAAARGDVRRRRPGDHRRLAGRPATSPRSARSRCAAARCSASSRRWSTPACRSRRSSRCSPASPTPWSPAPPRLESVLPAFLEFAARRGAGRAQRAVRRRLPQGRLRGHRARAGRVRRCSTPRGWPARWSPATRRPTASSSSAGAALPRGDHAQPPRAVRRAGDRRRAARADRAARQPRRALARGAARRSPRGSPPPSAASATSPRRCPPRPGVYLFARRARAGALRRHVQGPAQPGCAPTSPPPRPRTPDGRDGGARRRR